MTALALFVLLSCGVAANESPPGENGPGEAGVPAAASAHAGKARANRLAGESSPYLLLHAHNPVDWYPWGEEALARARAEDKPIFLSVGYSTCYWCHVMEREVFSNPEIAALMNRLFVNVKVDREERPDLDEIYMLATQALTGGGGWPNSVFLTPQLEPFFAGTYFPPEDRDGRPGFPTVLNQLHDAWTNRRADVEQVAARLADHVRQAIAGERAGSTGVPSAAAAGAVVEVLAGTYDAEHGGFGGAPKFPTPGRLFFLWRSGAPGGREHGMVVETLREMGRGGIYDQVGGGFHRYSTDERWLVPHFEKMLYDNAHLAELLAEAWWETGDPDLERLARGTLDFVLRELTLPEGAFKSAIDAETDAEEGAYYVWSTDELGEVLGAGGFTFLAPIYGFAGAPTFEGGRYVLHLTAPLGEHATRLEMTRAELLARIEPMLAKLQAARSRRERPLVDDKVLADWNGMMIAGMARAGELLGEPRYVAAAARAAAFVLERLDPPAAADGAKLPLRHVWRQGEARIDAFLDDYAFTIRGLLALHQATGEARWLAAAVRLADEMDARLAAPDGGYYLAAANDDLLVRPLTGTDGAIPSGNAIAALDLVELARKTGEERFRQRAARSLAAFAPDLARYPAAVPTLAAAVLAYREGERPAAAVTAEGGGAGSGEPGGAGVAAAKVAAGPGAESGEPGSEGSPTAAMDALARQVVAVSAALAGESGEAGEAGEDGAWRPFRVRLAIRDGWHVNANPASEEFLIPTAVAGGVRAVAYPPAVMTRFAFSESPLAVYSGEVTITGQISPDGETVRVTYQPCDDSRCLPPVTVTTPIAPAPRE